MKYNEYLYSNWEDRPQTKDEEEITNYVVNHCNLTKDTQLLHIGIGCNDLWHTITKKYFYSVEYTGITYCILEYEKVLPLHSSNYIPILMNKYNPVLSNILKKYDLICDNNIVSYADYDKEGLEYFKVLLNSLKDGGKILTHQLGLNYRRTANINEMLERLDLDKNFSVSSSDSVVIIEKI